MKIFESINPSQILTPEALEVSLPKFTVIQNLNHVILIFQNITQFISEPVDPTALNTFTTKYIEFRKNRLCFPPFHTTVRFGAIDDRLEAKELSSKNLQTDSMDLLLFEKSCHLNTVKTKRITRKILRDAVPSLSLAEKLNLVVTIFDFITHDEQDFVRLKQIIAGYVRFQEKSLALRH
jgi:hypothetical protein